MNFSIEAPESLRDSGLLKAVYKVSKRDGVDPYLVGGSIRDLIFLGDFCDYDFALSFDVESFVSALACELGAHYFRLGDDKACVRLVYYDGKEKIEADFSPLKADCIEEDLVRRDFTINAIACSLKNLFEEDFPEFIDPLGGRKDLEEGRLRLVSPECIDEDPLRILRGFRIAANLSLVMEDEFISLAEKKRGLLSRVSSERVRTELFKLFCSQNTLPYLENMLQTGVLQEIVPELSGWKDTDQGPHHDFCLLEHALKCVGHIDRVMSGQSPELASHEARISNHLDKMLEDGISRRSMLKFAALLHDSGKPSTLKREEGKLSFHGHEEKGALINKGIARRLKIGRFAGRALSNITRQHMRVLHLSRLEKITSRALARFVRDCADETPEILLLALADTWATREARALEHTDVESTVAGIMDYYYLPRDEGDAGFLRGSDVMRELGIPEGVKVGICLELVSEAERKGLVGSRDEALRFLRSDDLRIKAGSVLNALS